jgi:hypothetical protein
MSFRATLQRYTAVNAEARRLRRVLQSRYGWDEKKQLEEMERVLMRQPLLPQHPPVGKFGMPPRRGDLF